MPLCQYHIGRWISIIHRKSQIYMNRECKALDLNATEAFYLMHIGKFEPLKQSEISEHLSMDEALTTRTLRVMEKKDLLVRYKDEEDNRCQRVSLTEKGKSLQPKIKQILRNWVRLLTTDLPEDELQEVSLLLEKMATKSISLAHEGKHDKKGCDNA